MNNRFAPVPASLTSRGIPLGFALAVCAAFVVNLLRGISVALPHQLSDETAFLLSAKFFGDWDFVRSLGYHPVPGVAFLRIAARFARSDDYYLAIKVWNAACLAFAAIPAYFVARRGLPDTSAKVAAVIVALMPSTIYGAYFTPESTYIVVFWVFAAIALPALEAPGRLALALAVGATAAVAYLIKPHALALIAAYAVCVVILFTRAWLGQSPAEPSDTGWGCTRDACLHLAAFGLGVVATGLILGRLTTGTWLAALDLQLYSALVAPDTAAVRGRTSVTAEARLAILHIAAIVAGLAAPLAAAFGSLGRLVPRVATATRIEPRFVTLVLFAVAVLTMLLLMTVKASVDFHSIYGGANTLDRLHSRYYAFALPLLVFVAAGNFRGLRERPSSAVTATLAGVVVIVCCMLVTQRQTFTFIDAPDLAYLTPRHAVVDMATATIGVVAIAMAYIVPRWSILAAWALMVVFTGVIATRFQWNEDREQAGDAAVTAIRGLFPKEALNDGLIVTGAYPVAAARAAFRLASRSPVVLTLDDAHSRMTAATRWVLVLGDAAGGEFDAPALLAGGSAVYLLESSRIAWARAHDRKAMLYSLSANAKESVVARPAHPPEQWGTWLSAPEATVSFPRPLPRRGRLLVTFGVLDPRRQRGVALEVCDQKFVLDVGIGLVRRQVSYACSSSPSTIRFTGMMPLAPRDIGLSSDPRPLALALESIEVVAKDR